MSYTEQAEEYAESWFNFDNININNYNYEKDI